MRRLVRIIPALFLVASTLTFTGSQASAQVPCVLNPTCNPIPSAPDCKPPPPVRSSATGNSAMFDGDPAEMNGAPRTTTYEIYGVHPFSWSVYDPGCGGDVTQPTATVTTWIGNELLGAATDLVALGNGIHNLVFHPTWLKGFDTLETNATEVLHTHIWTVFFPISALCLAVIIIVGSRKQRAAQSLRMLAWALLVMAVVTVVVSEPVKLGHAADVAEITSVNTVTSALAGQQATTVNAPASIETDNLLYPAWLQGELGTSQGPLVAKYGAKLLDGSAYTWAEYNGGNPSGKVTDAKNKEYTAAAGAIHDTDQGAYNTLKGQSGDRIGAGVVALVGAGVVVPFRAMADLLVAASLLLIRLLIMFVPAIAVLAIHNRFASLLRGILMAAAAALINALLFSIASAVHVLFTGFLLSKASGLPTWAGLLFVALLSVVLWIMLKPFRKLTQMASASSPVSAFHQTMDKAAGEIKHLAKVGLAATTGYATGDAGVALAAMRKTSGEREAEPDDYEAPPVAEPQFQPEPIAVVHQVDDDGQDWMDDNPLSAPDPVSVPLVARWRETPAVEDQEAPVSPAPAPGSAGGPAGGMGAREGDSEAEPVDPLWSDEGWTWAEDEEPIADPTPDEFAAKVAEEEFREQVKQADASFNQPHEVVEEESA